MQEKIDNYVENICECFGFDKKEFIKPRGNRKLSSVRNMVFYILHQEMNLSLSAITKYFNRKVRIITSVNAVIKYRLQNNFSEETELYNKCKKAVRL